MRATSRQMARIEGNARMALACKFCIMTRGLKGSDIASLPQTEDELIEHVERDHHIAVVQPGETKAQALVRLWAKYPEASNPATCKCPDCAAQRKAESN
jgi:hypothetical protein